MSLLWDPTRGTTWTTLEGWEDTTEPSSEWSGSTGDYTDTTTQVLQGSQALTCTKTDGGSPEIISTSGDGLSQYPGKGNVMRLAMRTPAVGTSSDLSTMIIYGASGTNTYYYGEVKWSADSIFIRVKDGGAPTTVTSTTSGFTLSANTWYWAEITWDDGTLGGSNNDHTLEVYEDGSRGTNTASTSGNDSTHTTTTGVGVLCTNGTGGNQPFYDSYQVKD